jgi:hypothetical protein
MLSDVETIGFKSPRWSLLFKGNAIGVFSRFRYNLN